jgi:hypothetical protein
MSLVEDHWQFILLQNGEEELFDLRTDPGDLTNLAGQAGSAQQLVRFRARIAELVPNIGAVTARSDTGPPSATE